MKNTQQILARINAEIESLERVLKGTHRETQFRCMNEGALQAYRELKKFIEEDKWKP